LPEETAKAGKGSSVITPLTAAAALVTVVKSSHGSKIGMYDKLDDTLPAL
jgi:hypothetical protein